MTDTNISKESNEITAENEHEESIVKDLDDASVNEAIPAAQPETDEKQHHEGDHTSIEEDGDEDEEEEEEEEPPTLKYTRLNKLPANFFVKDPVSTSTFHETVFIFATHSGIIHICKPNFETIRTFKAHRASVLSVFTDGTYFATASMDGTVVIGSILDEKDIVAYDFQRPVHAVILDSNYYKTRSFISGGMAGQVIYSSKGWLGKRSDFVLEQGHGPIVSIQLIDDLVIWMNDKGISVFHLATRQIISVLEKPEDSPRSDLYWPRIAFPDPDRLIIGWSNYIWSLRVSLKTAQDEKEGTPISSGMSKILPSTASISFRAVQEKKVEVEHIFKLDSLISGIASFKDDLWMVLAYTPPEADAETGKKTFFNPDLKLINSTTGEVELEEELGLKEIANLGLNDFMLGTHIETIPKYYIISAKDGVIAEEFQISDCLAWYLDRKNYLQAWEISQHLVTPTKRLSYGILYVDSLIEEDNWEEAATFLQRLLVIKRDPNEIKSITQISTESNEEDLDKEILDYWETWSTIFINRLLPTSIYDTILRFWLKKDASRFKTLIELWDPSLYNISDIASELELEAKENETLERSLVTLYDKSHNPSKAVPHLIHLRDPNIIGYLSTNHILVPFVSELPVMIDLMFDKGDLKTLPVSKIEKRLQGVISILVDHRLEIPAKQIVNLFYESGLSFVSFFYLEKLADIDNFLVQGFGNERVKLYADYKREKLLPYLTKNDDYDIDTAITICETNDYTKELVYLLGKIGENKQALTLVINKLEDPVMAIEFAKHQNDKETWDILLDQSMSKPKFIKALIESSDESSNAFYDPITILQRMPQDFKIEGLNESVIEFSKNNDLNMLLNQIILKIIYKQSQETSEEFKSQKLRGFEVEIDKKIKKMIQQFQTIVAFVRDDNVKGGPKMVDIKLESDLTSDYSMVPYRDLAHKLDHLREIEENYF
ncbi:hypothetical protein FOB64_005762 [Candida albicans]|uniref:Vacuolar protein sorting-associated protein 41 n=1 Tax=Candida albicans TaxID=5476 RepID=A0A8H6F0W7_CANAX|nr:hypothetical protein FOB64_005762 [Candida albicans]